MSPLGYLSLGRYRQDPQTSHPPNHSVVLLVGPSKGGKVSRHPLFVLGRGSDESPAGHVSCLLISLPNKMIC